MTRIGSQRHRKKKLTAIGLAPGGSTVHIYTQTIHRTQKKQNTEQHKINTEHIFLLHVSTLLCHPQGARSSYLAKLHK